MDAYVLQERLKLFAYRIIPLCESLPPRRISRIIEDQLTRSAFSAAANYRAACKAQSSRAFAAKLSIAFEEMDESLFWLEVLLDLELLPARKLSMIIKAADELTRIFAASRKTTQNKLKKTLK